MISDSSDLYGSWYQKIPKVELHIHLEGAIPIDALWEIVRKYKNEHSVSSIEELGQKFVFRDFSQFIETWTWKNKFLREYDDFAYISEYVARDLLSQNIKYVEMFYSPSEFTVHGLEIQKLTESIRLGLSRVPEIEIALIADLVRDFGPEREMITLERIYEVKDSGVIGIGIGGSEREFPPQVFEQVFKRAREFGFKTNAHAGEAAGRESIWGAIDTLKVDRIGHGTRAFEDNRLLEYLAVHSFPLEMCPVSNIRTGVVHSIIDHPITDYYKRGMKVTVNTDDPTMFNTSLAYEFQRLVEKCGFSKADICRLILNGIEASWLAEDQKQNYIDDFVNNKFWNEL